MLIRKYTTSLVILLLLILTYPHAIAQNWTQITPLSPIPSYPNVRYAHTAVYDAANNQMTIFGGSSNGTTCLNDVWVMSTANGVTGVQWWTQITPSGTSPTPRATHSAVYDSANNRMIVYGGTTSLQALPTLNDVWVLNNANGLSGAATWTQLTTTGDPSFPRGRHTAVYDSINNRMIIFGGEDSYANFWNDVWVLNNANGLGGTPTWTQLSTSGTTPYGRVQHSAVYDNANNRMIIFGGYGYTIPTYGYLNDAWVLSHANGLGGTPVWTQLSTSGNPPIVRSSHRAVYDAIHNEMIMFGGLSVVSSSYTTLNDTWILSHANGLGGTPQWTQLSTMGTLPLTRDAHTIIYDNVNNRMSIFGGKDYLDNLLLNDVWVLSHANGLGGTPTWTQVTTPAPPIAPASRDGTSAIYDNVNNLMTIFGGYGGGFKNDTWLLNHANGLGGIASWTQLTTSGTPPFGRAYFSTVYDNANNRMMIFGGLSGDMRNDVWVLSYANSLGGTPTWTKLLADPDLLYGYPTARVGHTAVYDTTNNVMIIYGGFEWGTTLNDVWLLSHANGLGGTPTWQEIFPTNSQLTPRGAHSAVYDNFNNKMIIFGGNINGGPKLNDTWILNYANGLGGTPDWTQLLPTGSVPTTRTGHTAVYDNSNNRMVIFGGDNGSYLNETWVLSNANGTGGIPAWTQLTPTGDTPLTRRNQTVVYDNTHNRMIVFGGSGTTRNLNDTSVLDNASLPVELSSFESVLDK